MTNTTKAGEAPLLKTDTLGRVHTPATRREQLLDEFERSGTSGIKFAELTGLKYQTFATWVQQRRRQRKALAPPKATRSPVDAVRWLEAVVGPPTGQGLGLPLTVQLPERLQERGLAAPGLLAHVIVSKYCDHLPLYRQEQIFLRRHDVHLPRQTLDRWLELAADWLQPIYEHIRTGVLAGGYVQIDETPIRYLAPGHGQTKQGYLWAVHRPCGDALYRWETSRAATCLDNLLPVDFTGTIQCDGYAAYGAFAQRWPAAIALAGCWAHVRRKFFEALEQTPRTAGWCLRQIQHLYQVEARLRQQHAGPRLREATRAHQSRPIVARIRQALVLLKASHRHLPQSLLGQAIDYTLNQWPTLELFLSDGRVEIDNNLVENAIRPTALGQKNWLFIGAAGAGQRSAILYTVIESCRRREIVKCRSAVVGSAVFVPDWDRKLG